MTVKIAKLGCRIFEVPISYHGRDYAEGKKIGPKDAVSAVWTLLKYWVVSDIGHVGQHTLARMRELGLYNRTMFVLFSRYLGQSRAGDWRGRGEPVSVPARSRSGDPVRLRRRVPPSTATPVRHLRERPDSIPGPEHFPAGDVQADGIDSVVCLNVLEHVENDRRVLSELYRRSSLAASLPCWCRPIRPSIPTWTRTSVTSGATPRPRWSIFPRDRIRRRDGRYFNWVGAVGWYMFGRLLKRPHITKVATKGFGLGCETSDARGALSFQLWTVGHRDRPPAPLSLRPAAKSGRLSERPAGLDHRFLQRTDRISDSRGRPVLRASRRRW